METLQSNSAKILDILSNIKYVHAKHITNATGLSSREIRGIVRGLRLGGYLIGSGDKGYYLCETWEEYGKFKAREISAISNTQIMLNAMEKSAELKWSKQPNLL
jgi:DNA-binding IclR family transcriptional regulator